MIEITKEAIDSVPYFNLDVFSQTNCLELRNFCRQLLYVAKTKNNCGEVGVLIDSFNMKALRRYKGTETHVDLKYPWDKLVQDDPYEFSNRYIFIHNHPTNTGFSDTDITSFLGNKYIFCIIVVQANGSLHFLYKMEEMGRKVAFWYKQNFANRTEFYKYCQQDISQIKYRYVRRIENE